MAVEKADIIRIALSEAQTFNLDPYLVLAFIQVESGYRPTAVRFEKRYIYYYKTLEFANAQRITEDTETMLQKCSWGLMQLMGGTARFVGYCGFLPDLCDARTGVHWGCQYFRRVCKDQLKLPDQISVYNAGSIKKLANGNYVNQPYVDKIMAEIENLKKTLDLADYTLQ